MPVARSSSAMPRLKNEDALGFVRSPSFTRAHGQLRIDAGYTDKLAFVNACILDLVNRR
jgi:hypothetical protein